MKSKILSPSPLTLTIVLIAFALALTEAMQIQFLSLVLHSFVKSFFIVVGICVSFQGWQLLTTLNKFLIMQMIIASQTEPNLFADDESERASQRKEESEHGN